ncbi:hypothetical protein YC2023_052837 [Brassica napus]
MALIGYLSFGVSLDSFSGFSLSLGGSSLDGDGTPSWCLSSKDGWINFELFVANGWMNLLLFFAFSMRMMKGINQVFGTKFNAIQETLLIYFIVNKVFLLLTMKISRLSLHLNFLLLARMMLVSVGNEGRGLLLMIFC